jgi:type I restriction enzyme S subunit
MNTLLLEHFDQLISTSEDVERLEQSILALAVAGKLTISKASAASRVTESKLGNHIDLISGQHIMNADYNSDGDGVPYITGPADFGDIHPVISKWTTKPKVTALENDILITVKGAGLGKLNIVQGGPLAISRQLMAVRPKLELDQKYLYYVLKSKFEMFQESGVGIAIPGLSRKDINDLLILIPSLAEQGRVVARVEELFAQTRLLAEQLSHSRTELDRLNESALAHLLASETSEEFNERWAFIAEHFDLLTSAPEHIAPLRQSILELAVRGKLTRREPGDEPAKELLKGIQVDKAKLGFDEKLSSITESEEVYELPSSWEWARMSDICYQITDGTHHTPQYLYDGVPFLSVKDVSSGHLDFSDTKFIGQEAHEQLIARCKPEFGDVLLTKVGTTGIAVVVDTDREFSIFVSLALLKFFQDKISSAYLALLINSPVVKKQSEKYTMGVGNKNLVLKHIKNFLTPIPPLAEQERIVKRVEQLLGWCDALEAQLKSAEEERGRLVESVLARMGG